MYGITIIAHISRTMLLIKQFSLTNNKTTFLQMHKLYLPIHINGAVIWYGTKPRHPIS